MVAGLPHLVEADGALRRLHDTPAMKLSCRQPRQPGLIVRSDPPPPSGTERGVGAAAVRGSSCQVLETEKGYVVVTEGMQTPSSSEWVKLPPGRLLED